MRLNNYIFWGAYWGPVFKYLFVGGTLAWVTSYLVFAFTQNETIASSSATLVFLLFVGYFALRTWKQDKKEKEHYAREEARMKGMADDVKIDSSKCMSCTQILPDGEKICPNCGFNNKR